MIPVRQCGHCGDQNCGPPHGEQGLHDRYPPPNEAARQISSESSRIQHPRCKPHGPAHSPRRRCAGPSQPAGQIMTDQGRLWGNNVVLEIARLQHLTYFFPKNCAPQRRPSPNIGSAILRGPSSGRMAPCTGRQQTQIMIADRPCPGHWSISALVRSKPPTPAPSFFCPQPPAMERDNRWRFSLGVQAVPNSHALSTII